MRAVYAYVTMQSGRGARLVEERNGYKGCYMESLRLLSGHPNNRSSLVVGFCTAFAARVHGFTHDSSSYSVTALLIYEFKNQE